MNNTLKTRDYYFDTLKGFLIICVIFGNTLELANPQSIKTHYFILFLYMFHMPAFMFVSGYFSEKSKRTTVEKVKKTLGLYILAQIFYVLYCKIFLNINYDLTLFNTHWTFWYLLSLSVLYIFSDYIKNKKYWLIGSIIFSLLIGFDPSVGAPLSFERTFFYLPFFIAGMMFKKEHIEILKKKRIFLGILSLIVLVILYLIKDKTTVEMLFEYVGYSHFEGMGLYPLFTRIFHYFGGFILSAFLLTLIPSIKTPLAYLGEISLYLYLFHGTIAKTILPDLRFYNYLDSIISCSIVVILAIIFTKVFTFAKMRFSHKKEEKTTTI